LSFMLMKGGQRNNLINFAVLFNVGDETELGVAVTKLVGFLYLMMYGFFYLDFQRFVYLLYFKVLRYLSQSI